MRLPDATQKIAATLNFTEPISVEGSGEVRSLATSFKTMIEAVRQSQDNQRRLVADASHEMRTPLTSLRSNIELLDKIERLPPPERTEVINDVLGDIDELANLMGELVDLASDLGAAEPAEELSLVELAQSVAARTQRRSDRHVRVTETGAQDTFGRPRQLERALGNLVDNATKYSDPDTPVDIVVDNTTVTVEDRGRGVPQEDLSRIFDRFYRAVEVRTEPGSGWGSPSWTRSSRPAGARCSRATATGAAPRRGFTLPAADEANPGADR